MGRAQGQDLGLTATQDLCQSWKAHSSASSAASLTDKEVEARDRERVAQDHKQI